VPLKTVSSAATSSREPDVIWALVRDFCAPWHPAVEAMRREIDANGGLVRAFTVVGEDTVYRERLTWFSDSLRTMAYTHVEGIAGVEAYDGQLRVSGTDDGGSVIEMTGRVRAPSPRADEIARGTGAIFDSGLAEIVSLAGRAEAPLAETAPPHASMGVETVILPGPPRLAVSVTPKRSGLPAGEDTLCVFLHGIGGNRGNWQRQLAVVGPICRAAALDLRGYGDSALGPAQSTVDDYCDDILRVRAALGARKLILCGLSYGAWIATSFAMRHPDVLGGLILSGGCTGMSEAGAEEREAFRSSREQPLDKGLAPKDFAPGVVDVIAGPQAGTEVREDLLASMGRISVDTYRDALRCFTNPLEKFDFSKIGIPTLLVTGEFDRLAPPTEIRSVAARIREASPRPDVRFEVIAGAGHVCNLEASGRYNRLLLDVIGRFAAPA